MKQVDQKGFCKDSENNKEEWNSSKNLVLMWSVPQGKPCKVPKAKAPQGMPTVTIVHSKVLISYIPATQGQTGKHLQARSM